MRKINLLEDYYELYEWGLEDGFIKPEISYEDYDVLTFFEGDPDIIKVNDETGYFFYREETDTLYYYFDEWKGDNIGDILEEFIGKRLREESRDMSIQSWNWFNEANSAIAYRGGYGYYYYIYPILNAA